MLKDILWSEHRSYRSGSDSEPVQFYLDGLCNSNRFDLLLGYFSSAAISVLSVGFASFLYGGGKVRMVVNNVLSKEDRDAIKNARDGSSTAYVFDLTDIRKLRSTLNEYGVHFFECISWLIATSAIEIKIVKPKNESGISHFKSGTFSDGVDTVGFKASCNFTAFGLLQNLEELDAFMLWEDERSAKMVNQQNQDFETIFSGQANYVDYLEVEDVSVAIREEFGSKSINELLIQEKDLAEKKSNVLKNKKVKKSFEKAILKIDQIVKEPRFPYAEGPREYQIQAYNSWAANGFKGIFAMATGTGKTITALNCILEQKKISGSYKAIILVPTIGLADQWESEAKKFNFRNIIKINSSTDWPADLVTLHLEKHFIEASYIIIVTYASFYRPRFQEFFKHLDKNTILIGDEVHNMGSPTISRLFSSIQLQQRIGLSATPKRIYDEEGGKELELFFNDRDPYVYNYSMADAIRNNVLCSYLYYPHIVELTDLEQEQYIQISKQLAKFFDPSTNKYKSDGLVEMLLMKRKRIIHKAENKKPAFSSIIKEEYKSRGNLKYTLVYVPEGIDANFVENDHGTESEDDLNLIDQYTRMVSSVNKDVMVKQFTSGTANRERVIKDFSDGKLHVLTSMKCLDEGIDVPRSQLAVFCASTGNPRQFIQRRGRILRKHKDKVYAVIHDLVVLPKRSGNEETYSMERNQVQRELERVVNFSKLADNKTHTYEIFKQILEDYNLNLNDFES
jgi:superfamily II DNA or RNA helicase